MDKEIAKWLVVGSIAIVAVILLTLMLSGFDISGIEIHKGIRIH